MPTGATARLARLRLWPRLTRVTCVFSPGNGRLSAW